MQEFLAEQSNDTIIDPCTTDFLTLDYVLNQFSINPFILQGVLISKCDLQGFLDKWYSQAALLESR